MRIVNLLLRERLLKLFASPTASLSLLFRNYKSHIISSDDNNDNNNSRTLIKRFEIIVIDNNLTENTDKNTQKDIIALMRLEYQVEINTGNIIFDDNGLTAILTPIFFSQINSMFADINLPTISYSLFLRYIEKSKLVDFNS